MKKIYVWLLINVFISAIIAQNPITLSNTNMPGGGDTLRFTTVSLNSIQNYTQTGTNFLWNFESLNSGSEGIREFQSALSTPYFLYFLSASAYGEKIADTLIGGTSTLSITNYYNFYKKQSSPANAFIADGIGMSISGIPVPSYYTDKDELYFFPMTYPKYDSSSFKFSSLSTSLIPIQYSKSGYRVTVVDGWGTITTPYGTENCLRLITTQYSKDTTIITLPIGNLAPLKIGLNNYVRSYQWMTLNSKIPYFEVSGNLIGNTFIPTQARYRGYNRSKILSGINESDNDFSWTVYPNPAQNMLYISHSETIVKVEITDVNGKFIKRIDFNPFSDTQSIDISELKSGVYYLKPTGTEAIQSFRFVKQ